jgi:hypothetical protein
MAARGRRFHHAGRQCRCRGGTRLVRLWVTRVRPGPTRSDQKNMNMTRNGKIGRRPKAVREQANRRLEKGDFRAPTSSRLWTPLQPTRPLRIQPLPNVVTRKAGQRPALRPMSPSTSGGTGRRWNPEIYPGIAGFIRVNPSKSDHRKYAGNSEWAERRGKRGYPSRGFRRSFAWARPFRNRSTAVGSIT